MMIISFSGCSTFKNTLDIAGVIDKTEKLIFGSEEGSKNKNTDSEEFESPDFEEETYPDISNVPQERPDFAELDKEFFKGELSEDDENFTETMENSNETMENSNDSITKQNEDSMLDQTTDLVTKISYRVREKVKRLLAVSDPPTSDTKIVKLKDDLENDKVKVLKENKIAIIQFANNSVIPDTSANDVIKAIAENYIKNKIVLIGHSSSSGGNTPKGKRINMELSFARANSIKNMLINNGFREEDILTQGKGDLEPLKEISEKYGDAVNRRVEVFFY